MYKITTEIFKERALLLHNNFYSYDKSIYVNMKTSLIVTCPLHGDFLVTPSNHLHKTKPRGCPKCRYIKSSSHFRMTLNEFSEKANKIHNHKYIYNEGDYVNNRTPIKIICPIHGDFWQTPTSHLKGHGCPICSGNKKLTIEELIKEFKLVHGNKYIYDESEYINNHTPIKILCPKHGGFQQTPKEHKRGAGCPKCNQSKLEICIKNFLNKNKIDFKEQVHDFGLGRQSLDFYLPLYNIAIECQGIQHFQVHPFFHKDKISLITAINRDVCKYEKCQEQGVKILYFTKKYWLPEDGFSNPIFKNIYNENNVFTNLDELLKMISN